MSTIYRLSRIEYYATAFCGLGARVAGGRWNSKGIIVVYASCNRSLAAFETLVHIKPGFVRGLAPSSRRLQSQDNLTLVVLTASSENSTTAQESRQLGCVVSALKGIVPLGSAKFKPVSARLYPTIVSFLSSVAEIEQSPVAVLNTDAVLTALSVPTTSLVPL